MNIQATVHADGRQADGLVLIEVRAPDADVTRSLDISFEDLRRFCGADDPLALDFLLLASLCYVVDKMVSRGLAGDRWTRELNLSLPVSDPERWQSIAGELEEALGFLTGDIWSLSFTRLATEHWKAPRPKLKSEDFRADAVCLFSGGLDSLVGAIDLLASESGKKVLFLGHRDGAAAEQSLLIPHLQERFPDRCRLLRVRAGHRPKGAPETTLRSRSLLFLALGFYAARSYGPNVPLYACENGVIAINLPLTESRSGSCSTRTMHPFFLGILVQALAKVGFTNSLSNPLELKTKGECLAQCRDPKLLSEIASLAVSCSHATRRQHWERKVGTNNCGYCVPCLFRRASLHKAGLDDGLEYGLDVCRDELSTSSERKSANDLRAMTDFLSQTMSVAELADEAARIAPTPRLDERAAMLARGFDEVRDLFRDKGGDALQRAAGVSPAQKSGA